MITTELEKAADSRATRPSLLPEAAAELQPAPPSPACRIIQRGTGQSAGEAAHDGQEDVFGYVVEGRALLDMDGQRLMLEPGDCVVLPRGARRRFTVVEPLTMIESPMLPRSAGNRRS